MIKKSQIEIMNLYKKNIFMSKTIRELALLLKKDYPNTYNAVMELKEIDEKWSQKYKRSIDCNNPKGFSQRAHCQGRKKHK